MMSLMDRFLHLVSILLLLVNISHASLQSQLYWHSVFPKTPMPSAIHDLIYPDTFANQKSGTVVTVGKGGINVNTPKGTTVSVSPHGVGVKTGGNTHVGLGKGSVSVNTPKGTAVGVGPHGIGGNTHVGVSKSGVSVNSGNGKPANTNVNVGSGGVNVDVGGRNGNTHVGVAKGGVNIQTGNGKPGSTNTHVGHGDIGVDVDGHNGNTHVGVGKSGVNVNTGNGKKPGSTNVNVGHGSVGVNVRGRKGGNTHVSVGPRGVGVVTGHPAGKPPVVVVVPHSPFLYKYAETETQVHDDPRITLFFLEKDLHPGAKMNLQFTKTTSGTTFLPRKFADSIPFSSSKLPEVFSKFSISPNSVEAQRMKHTVAECEEPAATGENKLCATSLESMVEFSTTSLATMNVKAVSTEVKKQSTALKQEYTVATTGIHRLPGSKLVACHAEPYAYAVFYCHTTGKTKAYTVTLDGKMDGVRVEAVAVCHTDTAAWNPKHIAFKMLKVKPGTVPVCHFLPQDHVVWTPSA